MHRAFCVVTLAAVGGLLWATAALAQEKDLALLPDDEVLAAGEMSLEYLQEGLDPFRRHADRALALYAGVGGQAEIGIASAFAGSGSTVGLFEMSLLPPRPGRPAVMIGAQALGAGGTSLPYLLVSEQLPRLDLFVGAVRGRRRTFPVWSVAPDLTDQLGLVVEGIGGGRPVTGLGLSADLTPRLNLEIVRQFGETEPAGPQPTGREWLFDITYTWRPRKDPPAARAGPPASPPPPATEDSDTARSAAPRTPGR
jgi:hypothetical protein